MQCPVPCHEKIALFAFLSQQVYRASLCFEEVRVQRAWPGGGEPGPGYRRGWAPRGREERSGKAGDHPSGEPGGALVDLKAVAVGS